MVNHTPENHGPMGVTGQTQKRPCGWCVSTHVADIQCICEAPCRDAMGDLIGWCAKAEQGDPFAIAFV